MGDVHGRSSLDVDRGDVDGTSYGDWMLKAERGGDVDRVGGDVHLGGDGDGVAGSAAVHGRSVGRG